MALRRLRSHRVRRYTVPREIAVHPANAAQPGERAIVMVREGHGATGLKHAWTAEELQRGHIRWRFGHFLWMKSSWLTLTRRWRSFPPESDPADGSFGNIRFVERWQAIPPARTSENFAYPNEIRKIHLQRSERRAGSGPSDWRTLTKDLSKRIPAIAQCWRRVWDQVHPNEIRKIIYTTNAIESLHMQLRKVLKARGHFPSDEAATKLIYLVLRDITKKWKNPPITWKLAATQFAIRFGQRFFAVEI